MSAAFSPCRTYRYALWREWNDGPTVTFIGLNPSTADETKDDPTIRRCVGFAKSWGFGGLIMANLFALRATDPTEMLRHPEPVGPDNDAWLRGLAGRSGKVIAAWGVHGTHRKRDKAVLQMLGDKLHALALTKAGLPKHPLYLRADLTPFALRVGPPPPEGAPPA
jgi:hypothetical protein